MPGYLQVTKIFTNVRKTIRFLSFNVNDVEFKAFYVTSIKMRTYCSNVVINFRIITKLNQGC